MNDYEVRIKFPGKDEITLELTPKQFLDAMEALKLIQDGYEFKLVETTGLIDWNPKS